MNNTPKTVKASVAWPHHQHETAMVHDDNLIKYRIVALKRGECIRGYRVQRGFCGIWKNKGTLQFTVEAAREYREFLIRRDNEALTTTIEVIE